MTDQAAENKAAPGGPVTQQMYQDLLEEVENVTEQLTKTRDQFWTTQDKLRESEEKTQAFEMHIQELVAAREKDQETIKMLKTENSTQVEEEMKVRANLVLMKKVFARTQLKAKEDQDSLMLLQEERDLLIEENKLLSVSVSSEGSVPKHDKASTIRLQRLQRDSLEKEKHLTSIYENSKKELEQTKGKVIASEKKIASLQKQMSLMEDPDESQRQLEKQRKRIDALERALTEIHEEDEADILLRRALLDEDLEDSVTRQLLSKIDCGAYSMLGYDQPA